MRNSLFKKFNIFAILPVLAILGIFGFSLAASAQSYWVTDPVDCPSNDFGNYPGQNCNSLDICGVVDGNIDCYDTSLLAPPTASNTSITNYTGSFDGGYVMNCYANDGSAPRCDNNGTWWCDRNSTCYGNNKETVCTEDVGGASTCGDCRTGYYDCDADTSDCEIQSGVTSCTGGTWNASCTCTCDTYYYDKDADATDCEWGGPNVDGMNYHFETSATSSYQCNTGYTDCDGDLTEGNINSGSVVNGCEVQELSSCTTAYGSSGIVMGCSGSVANCVGDTMTFETGIEAKYATNTALLWGTQYGNGPLMQLTSYSASTTGGIFYIGNEGEIGVGTSTPDSSNALTVGYDAGSQFIINKSGVVTSGTWNGGVIGVGFGGTGLSSIATGSMMYANDTNSIAELTIGSSGEVLVVNGSGIPEWSATAPGTPHGILSAQHNDVDPSGAPSRGDLMVGSSTSIWSALSLGPNGYVLHSDGTDAIWESFNNLWSTQIVGTTTDALSEGGNNFYYTNGRFAADLFATTTDALSEGLLNFYYNTNLFAADLFATTTDALSEGSANRYWSDSLFYDRLNATTSLPNLATLAGLTSVGTIGSGTWNADTITVDYGGTGLTSVSTGYTLIGLDANSLQATSSLYISPSGYVGVGSTSPNMLLSVGGYADFAQGICIGGDCRTDWSAAGAFDGSGSTGAIATWEDSNTLTSSTTLSVAYGGTGTSTPFTVGSIVFADPLGRFNQNNDNFYWDNINNRLGLATSTPSALLTVSGNAIMDGNNRYFNFGGIVGSGGYGLRDNNGTLQYRHAGGPWANVGSSTVGSLNQISDVSISSAQWGHLLRFDGSSWVNVATNTLGIAISDTVGIVPVDRGGTGISSVSQGYTVIGLNASSLQATSSIYVSSSGNVGISSTTPDQKLSVGGYGDFRDGLCIGGDCITNWAESGSLSGTGNVNEIAIWTGSFTLGSSSTLPIYLGGTGATDALGARSNLGITNIYDYGINSQGGWGQLWLSDGVGRGSWVSTSSLGLLGSSTVENLSADVLARWNGAQFIDSLIQDDGSTIGIGTTSQSELLFIDGDMKISGNIYAYASTTEIGSLAKRINKGYFTELDVLDLTIGSTSISGSASDTFTINANNATADLEDAHLAFERGSVTPNATLSWVSADDILRINYPLGIYNDGTMVADLRFYEQSPGTNYVAFQASTSIDSNVTWILPREDANTAGQALLSDSSGQLYWGDPSGAGSVASGTPGWITYYEVYGNAVTATSSIYVAPSGNVGIGSSTPDRRLSVGGYGDFANGICIGGDCITNWGAAGLGGSGSAGTVAVWSSTNSLTSSSTLGINVGGTGLSTAPSFGQLLLGNQSGSYSLTATSSLGLVATNQIGSLVQGWNDGLEAIAGLATTTDLFIVAGNNTWESQSTSSVRSTLGLTDSYTYNNYLINSAGNFGEVWLSQGSGRGAWTATSSLGINLVDVNGTLPVTQGGTNLTSVPQGYTLIGLNTNSLQATSSIYVAPSGNVGIGSTSPDKILSVGGQADFLGGLCIDGSCITSWGQAGLGGSGSAGAIASWVDANTLTASNTLSVVYGGTGTSSPFTQGSLIFAGAGGVYDNDYDNLFYDKTNAFLGIGTTSPQTQLTVYGGALFSGVDRYLNFGALTGTNGYGFRDNGGTMQYKYSGGTWANIGSSTVGSLNDINDTNLSSVAWGDIIRWDGTDWVNVATSTLGFLASSSAENLTTNYLSKWNSGAFANSLLYDTGSYIGLGTTTPENLLEIDGSLGLDNQSELRLYEPDSAGRDYMAIRANASLGGNVTLTLPASAGSNGNALMTDGSGNLTWGNPSGSGSVASGTPGWLPVYSAYTNSLTATSTLYIDPNTSYVGISSTTPNEQLSVAGRADFRDGICIGGDCISSWGAAGAISGSGSTGEVAVWASPTSLEASSTLMVNVGGTGKSAWTPLAIPYLSTSTVFGEIPIGTADYLLSVNGTGDGYVWVDTGSVGVDTTLSPEEVEDYAGVLIASSTGIHSLITIAYDDADSSIDFSVNPDLSLYNNATSSFWSTSTGALPVGYGGTGLASVSLGQILVGNSSGGYTLTATSSLGLLRSEDIGSVLQAYDAQLFDIAGITPSDYGEIILWNGSNYIGAATSSLGFDNYRVWALGADSGTVNVVSSSTLLISGGTGLSTDITGSTITISAAGSYNIPLTASTTNWNTAYDIVTASSTYWDSSYLTVTASSTYWDTAYSWGDHSTYNYITDISNYTLGSLADVATSGLANLNVLYWNGSDWVPTATSTWDTNTQLSDAEIGAFGYIKYLTLGQLNDVSTSSLNVNDILYWNGSSWVTSATSSWISGLQTAYNNLDDVGAIGSQNYGDMIFWDGSNYVGVATTSLGLMRQEDIGSLIQAYDAQLTDIAGINPSSYGDMIFWNGSNYTGVSTSSLGLYTGSIASGTPGWIPYYSDYSNSLSATSAIAISNSGTVTVGNNFIVSGNTDLYSLSLGTTPVVSSRDFYNLQSLAIGYGNVISNTDGLAVAGLTGLGTSSPIARLTVYGNTLLSGPSRYLNFGAATSSDGYGFRDNDGTMQYKYAGGSWTNIGSSTVGSLNDINDTNLSSLSWGDMIYWDGTDWINQATTSLGLMRREDIGTLLQAYDAELADIAGINPSTYGDMIFYNGSNYAGVSTSSLGLYTGSIASGTPGYIPYYSAYSDSLTATSSIYVDTNSRIGIGTVAPDYTLDVNGDISLNQGLYHNDDSDTRFDFYIDQMMFWTGNEALLTLVEGADDIVKLGDGGDVDINLNDAGMLVGSSGFLGLGTTTPANLLDLYAADTDDYLMNIYNASSTASSGGGLNIRVDGDGALLNLNYAGTDVVTVTGAQTTFNNPVSFQSVGDVSLANDLVMTNGTAGNILFDGPGYIQTQSAWQDLDLTLSAANLGYIILDDQTSLTGTSTIADTLYVNAFTDRVGIGTSTPAAKLGVTGDIYVTGTTTFNHLAYVWPSSELANGILQTNGSGSLSWSSTSSLGLYAGTIASGTPGWIPYYSSYNNNLSATSTIHIDDTSRIGIGTSNPDELFEVFEGNMKIGDNSNSIYGLIFERSGGEIGRINTSDNNLSFLNSGSYIFDGDIMVMSQGDEGIVFHDNGGGDTDFWLAQINTDGDNGTDNDLFQIGDGATVGTNPFLTIDTFGKVGIGTTSPLAKLDVYGDVFISGPNRYINFGTSTAVGSATSSEGYGFRDNNGIVEYKNYGGSWTDLTSLGVSNLAGLTDTSVGSAAYGDLLMYDASGNWVDTATNTLGLMGTDLIASLSNGYVTKWNGSTFANTVMFEDGTNVGIGTTTPGANLHIVSASGDQLRLGYDQNNYADFLVNSSGQLSIDTADWDVSATGGFTGVDSIYNSDNHLTLGTTGSGDENIQLQAASGYTLLNAATQNYLQIYDSTGADYLQLTHDGTNAYITTNAGEINLGSGGSDVTLSSGVNIVGEGDFEIKGDSSTRIITLGDTDKANDDVVTVDASNWTVDSSGNVSLRSGGELRLYNLANTNYVGFVASTTADDTAWVLPAGDGTSGQAMITDGSGNLTWSNVGEGTVASGTTGYIPYYSDYSNSLSATSAVYIAESGNIGIGKTDPGDLLTVMGGDIVLREDDDGGDSVRLYADNGSGRVSVYSGGTETHRIDGGTPGVLFNSTGSANIDFRIESDTDEYAFFLDSSANTLGIGTSSPASKLTVYGDFFLEGTDRYVNFGTETGTSSYGFRDYGGVMQYKNDGGQWINIGSAGSAGALGSMSDVTVSSESWGDLLYYNGSGWVNSSTSTLGILSSSDIGSTIQGYDAQLFDIAGISPSSYGEMIFWDGSNYVGVATSSLGLLGTDVTSQMTADYLGRWNGSSFVDSLIYDDGSYVGLGTSSPLYALDIYGSGNLFRISTSGGDVLTVTESQITSYVPHAFSGSGNVSLTGDLHFAGTSGANVTSYGALDITSGDPGTDTNLYLSGQGLGQVYIDDAMTVTGSTTMAVWNNVIIVDGTTYAQNSTGIQAAINALPSSGGKVFLPAGTYSMTATTTIPNNVWIEGVGASTTVLRLADNANSTVFQNADTSGGNEHIKISNLKIEGNRANNSVVSYGVHFENVNKSEISNVFIYDMNFEGIYLNGSDQNIIANNRFEDNRYAINIYNSDRNTVAGNEDYNSRLVSFYIGSSSSYNNVSNNTIWDSAQYGIYLTYADDNLINANSIYDAGATGNYDGITITNSDRNIVSSNVIVDTAGVGYAIDIDSSSIDNVVSANKYSGTGAEGIRDQGVNSAFIQPERLALRTTATTSAVDYSAISANATTTAALVDVRQYGSGDILNVFDNSSEVFTILDGGNVGIGDSSPSYELVIKDIGGHAQLRIDGGSSDFPILDFARDGDTKWFIHSSFTGSTDNLTFSEDTIGNPRLTLLDGGNIGIGTTSPLAKLDVYGDVFLSGANRYINFGTSTAVGTATSSDGYGFRDNNGVMEYKNYGGSWLGFGDVGSLGGMSDVTITSEDYGDLLMYNGSNWVDVATSSLGLLGAEVTNNLTTNYLGRWNGSTFIDSLLYDNGTGIGIGTTTPTFALDIYGSGNLLRIATSGGDVLTVTEANITSHVPHAFTGSGNVTIGNDLYLNNSTQSTIFSQGPLSVISGNPGTDNNLYLEGRGVGQVYIDDAMTVTGSTTMAVWNNVIIVDGTTYAQNSTGIQAAIDALPDTGGKVFLPAGTYSMTATTTIPSYVWIEGAGASSTILYLADNSDCAVFENADTTNGNEYIKISNLKIDGNDAGNNSSQGYGIRFENVTYSEISNTQIYDVDDDGVIFVTSSNNIVRNNVVSSNTYGLLIRGSYNRLVNNTIENNLTGIRLNFATHNIVTNNHINSNSQEGVVFNEAQENIVANNNLYNNTGSNSNSSIYVGWNSDRNIIESNRIVDTAGTGYAIYVEYSNTSDLVLANNHYSGVGAEQIVDNGINTTYNQPERIALRTTATSSAVDYSAISANATTTAALVDIRQFGSGDIMNIFDNTSEVFTILDGGNIGIGTSAPLTSFSLQGVSGTDPFSIASSTGSPLFHVAQNGAVGIGTNNPASGQALTIVSTGNGDTDGIIVYSNNLTLNTEYGSAGMQANIASFDYDMVLSDGLRVYTNGGSNPSYVIDDYDNIGIGTSSPLAKLDVYGDVFISGANRYINFGTSTAVGTATSSDGYGFRDLNGTMQYKNYGGSWTNIGSAGSGGALGSLSDITITSAADGDLLVYDNNSSEWINSGNLGSSTAGYIPYYSANGRTLSGTSTIQFNDAGQVLIGDGSVNVPSIAFANDTDTGLYLANSNTIGFSTGAGNLAGYFDGSGLVVGGGVAGNARIIDEVGTAATPGYTFMSDLDTGMFRASADILGFSTAGTEALRIDASGNVMVGTSTAGSKLTVMSDTGSQLRLGYDSNNYVDLTVNSNGEFTIEGSGTDGSMLWIGDDTSEDIGILMDGNQNDFWLGIDDTDEAFHIGSSTTIGSSTLFTILNNGRVGIGTTSPSYNLAVSGTFYADDIYTSSSTFYMDGNPVLSNNTGLRLYNSGGNYASLRASTTASSNVSWTLPGSDGTAGQIIKTDGNGQLYFAAAPQDGLWTQNGSDIYYNSGKVAIGTSTTSQTLSLFGSAGTDIFSISTSTDSEIFFIDQNGNVGINTNSPSGIFHISPRVSGENSSVYTSDVTTGGSASASAENQAASNAFDDNTGTFWGDTNALPNWLQYDFGVGNDKTITKIRFMPNSTDSGYDGVNAFTFSGSDNASDWTDLYSGNHTPDDNSWGEYTFENETAYRYYRITITSADAGVTEDSAIFEMEMMETEATIPTNGFAIDDYARVGIGTTTIDSMLTIAAAGTSTGPVMNIKNGDYENIFTVLENGNVGIGNASPSNLLHLGTPSDATVFYVTDAGVVSADGRIIVDNGTVSLPGFGFRQDEDNGMYRPATNNLGLVTAGAERLRIDENGYVGIGTTSPDNKFTLYDNDTNDYLGYIYNASSTASSAGGLNIRVDGDGALLNLNHNGTDVVTVTGAQTTFNNPVSFQSVGDVSLANDLVMTNGDAGNILFDGPGYIRTDSSWENLDLTLSAANLGDVIVDDRFVTVGTTTLANLLYVNSFDNKVGIGTSSPEQTFVIQGTAGTIPFRVASSTGAPLFTIAQNGDATINGDLLLTGGSRTITTDSGQDIQLGWSSGGQVAITAGSGAGDDILLSTYGTNDVRFANSGTEYARFTDSGYFGLGTTSPDNKFTLYDNDTNDYLAYIYNASSTASSAGGLNIRVDGDGALLNLNYAGTDVMTVTGAQTTFSNPVSFESVGDVSLANDLVFSNSTAGNIVFDGPGYIKTDSAWQNLNLTLSAANLGQVVVDDKLNVTGTTTIDDVLYVNTFDNKIGIGTATPDAVLEIFSNTVTGSENVLAIATGTAGYIFRVDGDGNVYADGGTISSGADYAEYFYTVDTDLIPGETVCVDVTNENAVKRCDRAADSNVMGVVSSNPSIVGNYKSEYADSENYVIVAMLGQIPARVSNENGEIRPGDSLTPGIEPGYIAKAMPGDPTVGIALENFGETTLSPYEGEGWGEVGSTSTETVVPETGEIKVLISRRNKSLTVEMVESTVTDRIASMEIEDEVAIMLSRAIEDYNIASATEPVVEEQLAMFDAALTVEFDNVSGELLTIANELDSVIARVSTLENRLGEIDHRISALETASEPGLAHASSGSSSPAFAISDQGFIILSNDKEIVETLQARSEDASSTVEIYEPQGIVEIVTATSTQATALVINQRGSGDVADFQYNGVSIVNIADTGKVSVVGEMTVDGRLMVCSGSGCGEALDSSVDETMGDIGIEGTVVAGAFAGYCDEGYVWVPGSSKYGTMPGFCVQEDEMRYDYTLAPMVNMTQGEAKLTCEQIGDGHHLLTENEWLTIAENIIRNSDNDADEYETGLQLATTIVEDSLASSSEQASTSSIMFVLSNDNKIYNFAGGVSEWTDRTMTLAALFEPQSNNWQEYYAIEDFKGVDVTPPYYYTSSNGIGRVLTGIASTSVDYLRACVRGQSALFDLDLSHSPTEATSTIGFRCAK